ncbi:MAG TPA: class I SAM-dependent methyltransferase [Polyangia bacterium]
MEPASKKIYAREVQRDGRDSLSKIAQRIAPETRVLDLGCGPGALGAQLTTAKRCIVDGFEGNPEAAALARPHYRKVVVGDLETVSLEAHFGGERYDYIVCADVLEHLRAPEKIAEQLPSLLGPSGRILLSIPNVAYAGVVGALIGGQFEYRVDGLLDDTHLRFFTRASLEQFLAHCALTATYLDAVTMPIDQSEFARDHLERLPSSVLRTILAAPDALTYQFLVEAVPIAAAATEPVRARVDAVTFSFLAQLHWRAADEPFDASRAATLHGAMGADRQLMRFAIPAAARPPAALRLDPSNRPGYLRLYGMSLFDAAGERIWQWDAEPAPGKLKTNELHFERDEDDGSLLAVCTGDDPWFELPIDSEELVPLGGGGALEIDLAWPASPDAHLVIRRLQGLDKIPGRAAELQRLNDDMRAHIRTLSAEIKELQGQLRAARTTVAQLNGSLTFRVARPLHALVNRLRKRS